MGVYEIIKDRKTTYAFSNKGVDDAIIIKVLDAARLAPAAGSIHEYEFIVVSDKEMKTAISRAALTPKIDSAPIFVVTVCDPRKISAVFGEEDAGFLCAENAAMAIENLFLLCGELGLGTAWIANPDQDQIKDLLGIPKEYIIRGIIPIGYASTEQRQYDMSVPQLKEILHVEKFNNKA
jgi:nitroreductase